MNYACVQVSVPWLQGRTEDYRALCRYWASDEFIAKSKKARDARGSSGKHGMGVQGFVRMAKRMVSFLVVFIIFIM